ncbi:MAG TPA: PilZ domain-containing protein [Thermoanaerobaculia bacterium]|nr:PilZ domain-containing protein [Thermoanaerobaculia bacterium]
MYRASRTGFPRIPFVQSCTLEVEGVESPGMMCNLSVLGSFVDVEPLPRPKTEGMLRFRMPDGGAPVSTRVRIAWVNEAMAESPRALPRGCGLRFLGLDAAEVRRITDLVAAFEADPMPSGLNVDPARTTRVPFVAQCALAGPFGVLRGRVCNVSSQGVFVACDPVPELGAKVIAAFPLPGLDGLFERMGLVAWRNVEGEERTRALPVGCGVRLVNLSAEDERRLQRVVDDYLAGLPATV